MNHFDLAHAIANEIMHSTEAVQGKEVVRIAFKVVGEDGKEVDCGGLSERPLASLIYRVLRVYA